jgi:nitroimidazol reductase NimA-like FMN-containing flavoprotein (pyridoxamine 5'-phosphate oxidase superfamily)
MNQHPHAAMRRKEREITDRTEIDGILASSKVMYLGLADQNIPFVVPVFFVYDGAAIYFHSASAGSKIEIMKRNPKVCFVVSVDQGVIEDEKACDFEAKHRTVIGLGEAHFIEEEVEKIKVLDKIVALFSTERFEYPKSNLGHTTIVRIEIESLKGKKHGI